MAVITISREYGSGGDEVASQLCELLGYHSFGQAEINLAAEQTNFPKLHAVDYTEDNHEVQNFLDRLLGQTASPVQKIAWAEDPSIATRPERADVREEAVLCLVKQAIQAAVYAGNIVIVGRGGQVLLQDTPGVFHVRIEAPFEERLKRVMEQVRKEPGNTRSDRELQLAAGDIIVNRDIASADYIKRYYHVDWADPHLYHMVFNLGKLSIEQAVRMIAAVVQSVEKQSTGG